ncbi:hypothetical protein VHEMI08521 [[Torrubiella] hemipterigena]|uniref:GH64 domain-containing protein n=1 Tax=[Torrubiella] hemipterigena TaxID=1531966 RepID=A0A0A1TDR6_9HYPO|nr:hypothetical protein VHEMI08521 [[Torrubiella] hemipterigena]
MKFFTVLAALMATAMAAPSIQVRAPGDFTIAQPGTVHDMKVTKENTLNGTYHSDNTTIHSRAVNEARATGLPFQFVNNFGGSQVYAYVVGKDSSNRVVFVLADGTLVYPSSGGSGVPKPITQNIKIALPSRGNTLKMTLPMPLDSARIYFSEGELTFAMVKTDIGDGLVQPSVTNTQDPSAGLNWGFVELTYTPQRAIYANISYVDFVGMILSMSLTTTDGTPKQVTKGLDSGAVSSVCNGLADQGRSDGYPWSKMCVANKSGQPLRVLSPNDYTVIDGNGFKNYWDNYVNQVWTKYSSSPLTINTQGAAGKVSCKVTNNVLNCAGDNRGYNKPTAADIWGCNSGPFGKNGNENDVHLAVIARLCAAFTRSTLLANGGNVQPALASSNYYKTNPTSHYSRLVHVHEVDSKGYAFAYDDVNPDGNENASGVVSSGNPGTLTVYVGAPPA